MNKLLALLAVLCFASLASAKDFAVDSVYVSGNSRTKDWVIRRELGFKSGDKVNDRKLRRAQQRLYSLKIFTDVSVKRKGKDVNVEVTELWPYIPTLGVDIPDGSAGEIKSARDFFNVATVLVGGTHLNFRGEASRLSTYLQFGAKTGLLLSYHTRWLAPQFPYATDLSFQSFKIGDRHTAVLDSHRTMRDSQATFALSTHEGAHQRIGGELHFEHVEQDDNPPAEGRIDDTYWLSPFAVLDYRELTWYPSRGVYAFLETNFATGSADFMRTVADIRGYIPIRHVWLLEDERRPTTLALRITAGTTTQSTPSWARYYTGYNIGFRGYRSHRLEAANYFSEEAEFRFPLILESTYDVKFLGRYGENFPWGISGVLGGEQFQTRLDGVPTSGLAGMAGFLFRMPYVEIVEVSTEVNRDGEAAFIFGMGIRF